MSKVRKYWVTGASSGIGREVALLLAASGHTVFASSRSKDKLQALTTESAQCAAKGCIIPLTVDVCDDSAMADVFSNLPEGDRPDALDGAIFCAGICEYVDLPELDLDSFRRVNETNYLGVVNATKSALPLLRKSAEQGCRPVLAGVSSMSVYTGFPRAQAYGSAKAAMAYFLNAMRCDIGVWADVQVIYPGFVTTPMTAVNDFPMPFAISAQVAAQQIVASLHSGKRRIQFPWQLHCILAFARCFSGFWYKVMVPRLARNTGAGERADDTQK